MKVSFGEFTFDRTRQELRHGSELVHLTPKAMVLLEILLQWRGRVIRQQELVDLLWPDVVVCEGSLKNLVSMLRVALGDHDREGRFIRNIHGRGYCFNEAELVVENHGRATLRCLDRIFVLGDGSNLVGRGSECTVALGDVSVSRRHAIIEVNGDSAVLEDLGSTNGTLLDGVRVEERKLLAMTHVIRFGSVVAAFRLGVAAEDEIMVTPRSP
ncbi:MAG: FHA domain-containing protein [Thermoanaerobaculia bacterium]